MAVKRTERGWGGHFICADRCRFRRNTLLEFGDVTIVVSTVGAMMGRFGEGPPETIGCDRYYETMAFHAKSEGAYIEADVCRQVSFESEWSLDHWDADDIDMQADAMHEAVVAEISGRIVTGKLETEMETLLNSPSENDQ